MVLVTASEFRKNQRKYFEAALADTVAVKSGKVIYEIVPSSKIHLNPSPNGDSFWNDPHNLNELEKAVGEVVADVKSGKHKEYPTWDEFKKTLDV